MLDARPQDHSFFLSLRNMVPPSRHKRPFPFLRTACPAFRRKGKLPEYLLHLQRRPERYIVNYVFVVHSSKETRCEARPVNGKVNLVQHETERKAQSSDRSANRGNSGSIEAYE